MPDTRMPGWLARDGDEQPDTTIDWLVGEYFPLVDIDLTQAAT